MVRFPCQCVVPPYVLEKLATHSDPKVRGPAIQALQLAAAARTARTVRADAPMMSAIPSLKGGRNGASTT